MDVDETLSKAKQLLAQEKDLSPALRSIIEVLLLLVGVLVNRVTLNSKNSSKPPSSDLNRKKNKRINSSKSSKSTST
jgi:transposase